MRRRDECCKRRDRCGRKDHAHDRLHGCLSLVAFLALFVYPLILFVRWWRQLPRIKHGPRFQAPTAPDCQVIPAHIYRRPDPLIYSQRYLMSQGLAVTWINPDVTIEEGGVPVDPSSLTPDTTYDVVARIWNASVDAAAIGMPVNFSYLSFGIGTTQTPIGTTKVNLGAKGAPGCPAFATQSWKTPPTPGHYCLLIECVWEDDANPFNNIGQSNTEVKKLNSPHAAFTFQVENNERDRRVYRLAADAYALPQRQSCEGRAPAKFPLPSDEEIKAKAAAAREEHDPARFPVPADWAVVISPSQLELDAGAGVPVTVDVTAPDGFAGSKQFNVNAFDGQNRLIGGVSLVVES
jgi:hypothetical protein